MLWLPTAQAPAWRRHEARAPRLPSREAAVVGDVGPRIVLAKASRKQEAGLAGVRASRSGERRQLAGATAGGGALGKAGVRGRKGTSRRESERLGDVFF